MSKRLFKKELEREVANLRERFGELAGNPRDEELIGILVELHKDVAPNLFLENIKKPFCVECLSNTKRFFKMHLIQDCDEFCCPNCGITIPKIDMDNTGQPVENPEEATTREWFYKEDKTKKSYTDMEQLLTKYEEPTVRKRKTKKS
jgi:hypothetical protein